MEPEDEETKEEPMEQPSTQLVVLPSTSDKENENEAIQVNNLLVPGMKRKLDDRGAAKRPSAAKKAKYTK